MQKITIFCAVFSISPCKCIFDIKLVSNYGNKFIIIILIPIIILQILIINKNTSSPVSKYQSTIVTMYKNHFSMTKKIWPKYLQTTTDIIRHIIQSRSGQTIPMCKYLANGQMTQFHSHAKTLYMFNAKSYEIRLTNKLGLTITQLLTISRAKFHTLLK